VAAVAAETPEAVEEALEKIDVEYEVREPVLDPEEALEDDAPRVHNEEDPQGIASPERNVAAELHAEYGDVEEGFEEADHVFENEYEVTKVQQTPIEPHVSIGWMDEDGRLNLRTSTQVPYHVRRIVSSVLDLDIKDIRAHKPRIGGGFGVKQEILIEDLVGMMAKRTDRPCKLEFTRQEEFEASRSRHPYRVKMKTGVNEDGHITANSMELISDTGAHGTHGLTVASVTGSKTIPLYLADNVLFDATIAYTNHPPSGAYRGYGAPQGYFPLESHMEEVARALDMDPVEFRRQNHIDVDDDNVMAVPLGEGGEGHPQVVKSCGLEECIDKGLEAIDWDNYFNQQKEDGPVVRGVGMAIIMQATGIPGVDMGSARVKMNEDGSFNLHFGATDLGTGADTVLAQMAAETLAVESDDIIVHSADTDHTPFDTGAYASSTTFVSGGAVTEACKKVRKQILERASLLLEEPEEHLVLEYKKVVSTETGEQVPYSKICKDALYVNEQRQIQGDGSFMSYESPPPFAAHFAQVAIDKETGELDVEKYVAATDCGLPINPQACHGQVE
ncbi:MAG: xanthine dehydrogenase family protein molybdopterin-binding subunit, partial [bacterium]